MDVAADDDDGGGDDDDDSGNDDVAPLCVRRNMALLFLPIPPTNELRRLGFCLVEEFLISLGV